ncbi:MoaD/ThiS family protein [Actinokineospora auranticolor]|uniref:Molybdopterin converting factor small subunit n=1 Tax=Actinokineospora auranticolor TaxID=155976 RepID=A0A2S6GZ69_9PSEU|nr:MoaD/ThiS family protein [Actinokineospora auranticolor]PPK70529.1 molybdopterin converting factor small subunit [Actinokineospora auranticolor]
MGVNTVVRVRYFAGARAAAGVHEEEVSLPHGATVADAVTSIAARHGDGLARVLAAASFLLDGVAVRDRATPVPHGTGLDVLPPFAGG